MLFSWVWKKILLMAKTFRGDLSTGFGKDFEIFLKNLFWGSLSKCPFTDSEFRRGKINDLLKIFLRKILFVFELAPPSGSRRERQFYYHFSKVFYFLLFAQMVKQEIVQKKKHLPRWQVLNSMGLSFWYVVVDFDHKTADNFMIKVNPAKIVYPSNNVIKSFAASMIWAG